MKLAALLEEKQILVHMTSTSFEEAVGELVGVLQEGLGELDPATVCQEIMAVEKQLPLPPAEGVRIPHGRFDGLPRVLMAVGTSQQGIPYPGDGDERVHLIFVILSPRSQSAAMLQTMAAVARFVHAAAPRKAFVSTTAAARALRILEESGIEIKKAIVAADLMAPPGRTLAPEMTLREVVRTLVESHEEGLPVVQPETGELLGEVTCHMVIEIGLPRYMKLVTDPAILSDFEPFERYYRKEDTITAEEIMRREIVTLAPETPAEIVAHEMLTRRCLRAYIVREKHLLGSVFRKDIVRKVFYL